jgi:uncharacterized repeat protein (TIGR02543 family)
MMKNKLFTAGTAALLLAFALAGCSNPAGGGNPGPQTWTVRFEANGGSPAPAVQTINDGGTASPPPSMTKSDGGGRYPFGGWYGEAALTTPWIWTNAVNNDMTLHAKWGAAVGVNDCIVRFDTGGGIPALDDQAVTSGGNATNPGTITKTGYAFINWCTEPAWNTTWTFGSDTVTADMTLYAEWAIETYLISYTLNSGDPLSSPPTSYTIETSDITLPTPSRAKHTFAGWYDNTGFNGSPVAKIPKGSSGDKTFYAKWTRNPGEITFTKLDSEYNGQYAIFRSSSSTQPSAVGADILLGFGGTFSNGIKGVQISGRSVTLPVYLGNRPASGPGEIVGQYNGNDQNIKIYLIIKETPNFMEADIDNRGTYTVEEVDFSAGDASVDISTATVQKTLKVTGITIYDPADDYADALLGIVKSGMSQSEMLELSRRFTYNISTSEHDLRKLGFIAGARYKPGSSFDDLTFAKVGDMDWTATATPHLTQIPMLQNGPRWTGSGTYDVYLITTNLEGFTSIFQKTGVPFNPDGTPATVSFLAFSPVLP